MEINWIDWGIPDRSTGKSFPSTSIFGVGFGELLDFALILSPEAGGGGADKLVTDDGNIEPGRGDDEVLDAIVVIFDSISFRFVADEGDDSTSEDNFVGAAVVEILIFDGIVAGVDDITPFNGGALNRK